MTTLIFGDNAFKDDISLVSITLPDNISLRNNVFIGCTNLVRINVSATFNNFDQFTLQQLGLPTTQVIIYYASGNPNVPRVDQRNGYTYIDSRYIVCFKEDSKLLCFVGGREKYVAIQDIRPGTLVKTLAHGYKQVALIGKTKIYNPGNKLHYKNRLYKCTPAKYPELTEDLVITGCHSILVDEITADERETTMELLGKIYATDDKYRLLACIDKRAEPYEEEGLHTIWHLALEHENIFVNYGVYANGLLVETCSKRMMSEYSGMELVE